LLQIRGYLCKYTSHLEATSTEKAQKVLTAAKYEALRVRDLQGDDRWKAVSTIA